MSADSTPASANAGSSTDQGTSTGQGTLTGQGTSTKSSSSQSQERMYLVPAALARPDQDGSTMLTLHLRFSPILDLGASRVQVFVISKHGIVAYHPRLTPSDLRAGRCSMRLKLGEMADLVPGLLHVLVLQHVLNPQQCLVSTGHVQIPDPEARASHDAQTVLLAALPVLLLPPKVAAEVQRHFEDMVREVQQGTYFFLDQSETASGSMGHSDDSLQQVAAAVRAFQSNSVEEGLSQESSRASQRREAALDELETWLSPNLASHLQQWRAASNSRASSDVSGDLGSSSASVAQHEGAARSASVPVNMAEDTLTFQSPNPDSGNAQGQHRMAMSEAGGSGVFELNQPPALFIPPASPDAIEEGYESLSPTAAWVSATSPGAAAPAPPARPPSSQTLQQLGSSVAAAAQPSSPSATPSHPQAIEGASLDSAQAAVASQASDGCNQQPAVEPAANEAGQSTGVALAPSFLSSQFGNEPLGLNMQMLDSLLPSSLSARAIHGAAARLLAQPTHPGQPQGAQPAASARATLSRHLPMCRFRPAEAFVSHLHLAPFAHHLDTLRAAAEQAIAGGRNPGHTLQVSTGTGPSSSQNPVCSGADRQPAPASSSGGKAELQVDLDAILAAVCGFAPPREGQAGSGAEPNPVAPSSLFGDVMASAGDSGALRLRVPDAPAGLVDAVIFGWREANQSPDAAAQAASVALTPALLRFLLQNRLIDCFELVGGWVHDAGLLSLVCGGHTVDSAEAAAYVKEQLARYERPVLTVQGARNVVQPLGFVVEEEGDGEEQGSQEGQSRGGSAGGEDDEPQDVMPDVLGPDPSEPHARSTAADDRRQLAHAAETERAVLQPPAQESLPPAAMPAADTVQLPKRNSGGVLRAAAPGLLHAALTGAQLFGHALGWAAQAFARGAISLWRIATMPDAAGGSVLKTDARVLLARLTMSGLLGVMVLASSLPGSSEEHWPEQESKAPRGSRVLAVARWLLLREPPVLLTMAFSPSAYMMYRPLMISGVLSVGAIQIMELLGEAAWELRDSQFPLIALAVVYFVIEALVTPLVLTMQQQLALLVIVTQVAPVALLPLTKLIQPPLAFGPALEGGLPAPPQREELTVPLTVVLGLGLVQLLAICLREHKSLLVGQQAA